MRTTIYVAALALAGFTGGCKWTDFDDLADKTWVRSTEKPNIGSNNYAIGLIGVTTGSSGGGQLAVVSDDSPNYSTLDYKADGTAAVGPSPQKLGSHFIATLSEPPILVTDGNGKVALVEHAIDAGNIAVVMGPASQPSDSPFAATFTPDSATFAGANLEVAAGPSIYTLTGSGAPTPCASTDTAFRAAALASDGTTLWSWSTNGVFSGVAVSALTPCTGGLPTPGFSFTTTGFMPGTGAKIHLVGNFAILAAHAGSSRMGQVFVVDIATMTQVGTPLSVDGLRSSTVAVLGTTTYVVLGAPDRAVDDLVSGQVDVYAFDTTTGTLGAAPALVLNDAQPESGEQFGRAVTTMKFNDKNILVVGANNEIFAYYKTALYDALP